jgi:hypothetical protein
MLTLKLRALVTLKRQLKLLTLAFQLLIVSRPLLRHAEAGIGVENVPEPRSSIRIAGMEIGMVRLDGRAERFLVSFFVVIRTRTEQLAKRFHRACSRSVRRNRRKTPACSQYAKSARPTISLKVCISWRASEERAN